MVRVLFLHPDLGIGGAERLVVDAALALKSRGHVVSFLTNHHDESHCFQETRDGTLAVKTVGDWLPRNIFGKFSAFCAYLRMIYAAFYTVLVVSQNERIDAIFCDQVSLGIPILRFAKHNPKILFYCHFPDQLQTKPGGLLKRIYRAPLNFLEERTTGQADRVLVNSKFTRRVFKSTFKRLSLDPDVLYPSLNTKFFDSLPPEDEIASRIPSKAFIFLSINRFERKKNLTLAVDTFRDIAGWVSAAEFDRMHMIVAGGYDTRMAENVEHFEELQSLAKRYKIQDKITFLRSPKDTTKLWLLSAAHVLLYTPENEHFGIVPLEGMYMAKPVIAVNSGGPMETIVDESTGFLCQPTPGDFRKPMLKLFREPQLIDSMGQMGRKRVQQKFSFEAFTASLNSIIEELLADNQ
ncbi:alpha-1,3/1,6-mannosyltransferase ALG2 [Phlebotomus argentipes]|uniref:alpha-1,3/1,6-mannosyltransferase ALG2 n=1 Tax=Phlebotomus argentipes TaxID=94469 RepID=UPI002892D267|nr:alpha-1,3/1,6-mannosyltransferase ALG2 [Phlebotomus argentipes]